MTSTTPTTSQHETDANNAAAQPWGDDFDATRAWTLVQGLRSDKAALQSRLAAAETAQQGSAERAVKAEAAAATATRDLTVERVRAKHDLPEDLLDFLTGTTQEELTAQAVRLSSIGRPAPAPETAATVIQQGVRPTDGTTPALIPGHGPNEAAVADTDAVVSRIRANRA